MTTVSRPPAVRAPPEGWEAAPAAPDPPPPSPPSPRGSRRLTWRAAGFGTALVALTLAIPVLAYAGARTVLDSNEGRVIDPETDPTAPGFEAVIEPTPTYLVNMVDDEGDLAGTVAISLAAEDQGGTMLFFPTTLVLPIPLTADGVGSLTTIYEMGGREGLVQRVETLMNTKLGGSSDLAPDRWESLVGPVSPLMFDNPTELQVTSESGEVIDFPLGPIELSADLAAVYVTGKDDDETDVPRIGRQQAFWSAWVEAVSTSTDPDVVPGETSVGVGRFVRGLAAGEHASIVAPNEQVPIPGVPAPSSDYFVPADDELAAVVDTMIPFPIGVDRLRTRILDGVGEAGLASEAATPLVGAGAAISIIGNTEEFGVTQTLIVYFRAEDEAIVQGFRAALGVGRVERSETTSDAIDVAIVLGRDYFESRGGVALDPLGLDTLIEAPGEGDGVSAGNPGGDPAG